MTSPDTREDTRDTQEFEICYIAGFQSEIVGVPRCPRTRTIHMSPAGVR